MNRLVFCIPFFCSIAFDQSDVVDKLWVSQRPLKVNDKISLQSFFLSLDSTEVFQVDEWFQEAVVTEAIDKSGAHRSTSALYMVTESKIHFHINMSYWKFEKGDDFSINYLLTNKNGVKALYVKTENDEGYFYLKE